MPRRKAKSLIHRATIECLETRKLMTAPTVQSVVIDYEHSPHKIKVQFDQDVSASLTASDLVLEKDTSDSRISYIGTPLSYDHGSNTATFSYNTGGSTSANFHIAIAATSVANSNGDFLQQGVDTHSYFFLLGDINHDRIVDSSDEAIVSAHLNQTGTYSNGDVNYDGTVDTDDQSDVSDYAAAGTTLPASPLAPTGFTVLQPSSTERDLTWVDNTTAEAGYRIQRSTDGALFSTIGTVGTDITDYADTGLTSGTHYWYRVRAYGNGVDSAYTNAVDSTTLLNTPTSLATSNVTAHSLDLAWTDNSSSETGYEIQFSRAGGDYKLYKTVAANTQSCPVSGLAAQNAYTFRVRAIGSTAVSSYSSTATTTMQSGQPIVLVAQADYQPGPHDISFEFDQDVWASLSTSDLYLTNLDTGSQISAGQMSLSHSGNVVTFSFTSGNLSAGHYEAILNASGITNSAQQAMSSDYAYNFLYLAYDVNRDGVIDKLDKGIVSTHFGLSSVGFENGDTDFNGIVAVGDFNNVSNHFGAQLDPLPASPIAPNATPITTDDPRHKIKLTWTAPAGTFSGYHIWRYDGSSYTQIGGNITATNYTDTGLTEAAVYTYFVRAYSSAGNSPATEVTAKTFSAMDAKIDLSGGTRQGIKQDSGTAYSTSAIEWQDWDGAADLRDDSLFHNSSTFGDHGVPLSFNVSSGGTITVAPIIAMNQDPGSGVSIKGVLQAVSGTGGWSSYTFTWNTPTKTSLGGGMYQLSGSAQTFPTALPSMIFGGTITIDWSVELTASGSAVPVSYGTTKNNLYVSGSSAAANMQETILNIGCTNAKGKTVSANGAQTVAESIFSGFEIPGIVITNPVKRMDGTIMRYGTAGNLLTDTAATGQCDDWALLLQEIFAAQSVNSNIRMLVSPESDDPNAAYIDFAVKDFDQATGSTNGRDNQMLKVQGGDDLTGVWTYHKVVVLDGIDELFDPSIGRRTTTSIHGDAFYTWRYRYADDPVPTLHMYEEDDQHSTTHGDLIE